MHGPVMKTEEGAWAIRYAGIGRALQAGEQWFRMNKARSFEEWKQAMTMQAIPMFNTVYADREHILYVYNALLPVRPPGHDWLAVLPGNESALVWTDYLPFDRLPQVLDPPSGFVQSCNSTPWRTTTGDANPRAESFAANLGIETNVTNRTVRSLALFGTDAPIHAGGLLPLQVGPRLRQGRRDHAPGGAAIEGRPRGRRCGGRGALHPRCLECRGRRELPRRDHRESSRGAA